MKKKLVIALLTVGCVISLSACAEKEENQESNNNGSITESVSTETDSDIQEETLQEEQSNESSENDNASMVLESQLGYSMKYNPTAFTLNNTEDTDTYTYNTTESLDAPVYLSVQKHSDTDAQTLAEGLALQSGIDGVEVQDAYFGADSIETKNVYIEKEMDGVKQIQVFYAIPAGEGSLLLEITSYAGVTEAVDVELEEMLATFTLTAE